MPNCHSCDEQTSHVWRHEVLAGETSRPVRWLCRSCHPEIRTSTRGEPPGQGSSGRTTGAAADSSVPTETVPGTDAETAGSDAREIRSDGGVHTAVSPVSGLPDPDEGPRCPSCGSETLNGQGMCRCTDCEWIGAL